MDTKKYLKNVYDKYQLIKDNITFAEKHRYCGAMECSLCYLGIFTPESKFTYKSQKIKWFFGLFTYEVKESYTEMIERLTLDYLTINKE